MARELDMVKLLPVEVLHSILLPLPACRLQQLRLVLRSWNALINSSDFKHRHALLSREKCWLGMSGTAAAYHVASSSWCALPVHDFGLHSGRWKAGGHNDDLHEHTSKSDGLDSRRWKAGGHNDDSHEHSSKSDEDSEQSDYDFEHSDEDSCGDDVMDLTWTQDGALACCMACPSDDDDGYDIDDDSTCPKVRFMVHDGSNGSCKEVTDFGACWFPFGVGIQVKPDGKDYYLVVASDIYIEEADGHTIAVSVYDSTTKQRKKVCTACNVSKVEKIYYSNFVLDGCFYLLLMYRNGFISLLTYKIASDSWQHWDTTLERDFFSRVSLDANLLRCRGRILAVGGTQMLSSPAILELKKLLEEGSTPKVEKNRRDNCVLPPKYAQLHKQGTWVEIARMPTEMWIELSKCFKKLRVVGNDYCVFILPKPKFQPGQKGVIFNLRTGTWQWMAPFPEKCEGTEALHWAQLFVDSSTVIHHPKSSIFGDDYTYDGDDYPYSEAYCSMLSDDSDY